MESPISSFDLNRFREDVRDVEEAAHGAWNLGDDLNDDWMASDLGIALDEIETLAGQLARALYRAHGIVRGLEG